MEGALNNPLFQFILLSVVLKTVASFLFEYTPLDRIVHPKGTYFPKKDLRYQTVVGLGVLFCWAFGYSPILEMFQFDIVHPNIAEPLDIGISAVLLARGTSFWHDVMKEQKKLKKLGIEKQELEVESLKKENEK
jgi:hypothetical protein